MAHGKVNINEFMRLSENITIADVRSPSEFEYGHIPGAVNIPLFDDEERKIVGIKYKRSGRVPAIIEGLKQCGQDLDLKLKQAIKYSNNGRLLVHCWRGGMRSEAMAWLFSLGDIDVKVLNGGYKAYRHLVIDSLSEKRKTIILGGMTGSSKTHILKYLNEKGSQVIDLEMLANHKGSAFGALGQLPQPTSEYFSNLLYQQWNKLDSNEPCWIEDESQSIGSVFLPDNFFLNMQNSPVIVLIMDIKTRMPRLIEEYSAFPPEVLKRSVLKISRRLGGEKTRDATNAIDNGDLAKAIEIVLYYYDKAYMFGIKSKKTQSIIYINTETDDIESNALKVLEAAGKIKWE